MRVLHLNKSDINGGAARAAYRAHRALRQSGIDSYMSVDYKQTDDYAIFTSKKIITELRVKINQLFSKLILFVFTTDNKVLHSLSYFTSGKLLELNKNEIDLVHLHWVQGEMLSINEIGKINKPVVWTLHDMWAFCGAEHYSQDKRYVSGYYKYNCRLDETKFDLNRWVWNRKKKYWKKPIHIITPSHWLARCVQESELMRDWPVSVIPNAIDTDIWQPIEKNIARTLLKLPHDKKILLFGAMGGGVDPRKGFDLLLLTLQQLKHNRSDIELVIFGQLAPENPPDLGFRVHYMGHLHDDISLNILYSAADIMLIPSRQDNLPNTGLESLACGTPIVAFDTCGLPDIVKHKQTGYLATAFEINDFVNGILWILEDEETQKYLFQNTRQYAVENFSYSVVAKKHKSLYESIIGEK